MKKVLSILIVNILCLTAVAAQENVSDIRVELRDTLLNVTYNLQKDSNIEVFYSSSDGAKYIGPLKEVTGDCGVDVKAGTDRVIVWNPVEEVGYIEAPNSVIKIVADAIPEPEPEPEPEPIAKKDWGKHNVIMVGANLINGEMGDMPLTFMYGHYRHFGWYVKFESDISKQSSKIIWGDDAIGMTLSDDELKSDWISGKVGFIWNINNHFLANFGIGAQQDKMYIGEEGDGTLGDGFLCILDPDDYKTVANGDRLLMVGEIGLIYNWRKLSIGVNVTPILNHFSGYEGMGAAEYSQSYSGRVDDGVKISGEYSKYYEEATPIYKTKLITNISIGINF